MISREKLSIKQQANSKLIVIMKKIICFFALLMCFSILLEAQIKQVQGKKNKPKIIKKQEKDAPITIFSCTKAFYNTPPNPNYLAPETYKQGVMGNICNATTGLPISHVVVELLLDQKVVARTSTNEKGFYAIAPKEPIAHLMTYQLKVYYNNPIDWPSIDYFPKEIKQVLLLPNRANTLNISLEEVKKVPKDAITQSKATGILMGNITDQKTGEGIPFAIVTVTINGSVRKAQTDFEGFYDIKSVPFGDYTVTASYVGYEENQTNDVSIYPNKKTVLNVALKERTDIIEAVIVKDVCY